MKIKRKRIYRYSASQKKAALRVWIENKDQTIERAAKKAKVPKETLRKWIDDYCNKKHLPINV